MRDERGRWLRGTSGNPGGRPKEVAEVRELARQHTIEAIETLVEIMRHGSPDRVRVEAARVLLDRAWGRPTEHVELQGPRIVLDEKVARDIGAALRDLEAMRNGKDT